MEGTPIAVTGSATDPAGANDTLSYAWTVNKGGGPTAFASGSGCELELHADGQRQLPDRADGRATRTAAAPRPRPDDQRGQRGAEPDASSASARRRWKARRSR